MRPFRAPSGGMGGRILARRILFPAMALLPAAPARAAPPDRPVSIWAANLRKGARVRLYDQAGRVRREAVRSVEDLLRCHKTGRRHAIDPRLVELIGRVARRFPGRRIEVVSGYRHPRVSRSRTSRHVHGRAVDVRVVGVSNLRLARWLRTLPAVGVGYYPNSTFVHIDVRDRATFWVDVSRPGQRPRYASAPERYLARPASRGEAGPIRSRKDEAGRPAPVAVATAARPAAPASVASRPPPPVAPARRSPARHDPLPIGGGPAFGWGAAGR